MTSQEPFIVVGGGIGGLAVAAALKQHNFPVEVYERDVSFASRPQGYSLTIQQGLRVLDYLGLGDAIRALPCRCLRSVTLDKDAHVLFGSLTRQREEGWIPVPRQQLRRMLLDLCGEDCVHFGKQFSSLAEDEDGVTVIFEDGTSVRGRAVIAADGLRSRIRETFFPEKLNYLGVMDILGIVPSNHDLTNQCVFQTLDGTARFFCKPFDMETTVWQLTFPHPADQLTQFACLQDVKDEALRYVQGWHEPIEELVRNTPLTAIRAGGVFDRDLPQPWQSGRVTILGDAAHPMSPFKGQGANQALDDAWALARAVNTHPENIPRAFSVYERDMLVRVRPKVLASRAAIYFLHSSLALDLAAHRAFKQSQVVLQMRSRQEAIALLRQADEKGSKRLPTRIDAVTEALRDAHMSADTTPAR